MDIATVLQLVRDKLGIKSTARDNYLTAIVNGVVKELKDEKGLVLDSTNPYHLIFVADYAAWRFENQDSQDGMPRHLQYRLHNLIIHVGSTNLVVNGILTVDVLPVTPAENTVYILNTDGSKQIYINNIWTIVDFVNGFWVVV